MKLINTLNQNMNFDMNNKIIKYEVKKCSMMKIILIKSY